MAILLYIAMMGFGCLWVCYHLKKPNHPSLFLTLQSWKKLEAPMGPGPLGPGPLGPGSLRPRAPGPGSLRPRAPEAQGPWAQVLEAHRP